jgi:hypothetical protein
MNKLRFTFQALVFVICTLAFASFAQAQASRTWVSGVGDDANPCSRTAPCKTFAGAISKTAAGGEIDALDPAGFGAVTITKGMLIDGGGGQVASVLVAGTNGIVVQAGASDVVALRNLRINGISGSGNGGINGIRFLSGKALHIEDCVIMNFTTHGIDDESSTVGAGLFVSDTDIRNCGGAGIFMSTTAFPGVATIVRVNSKGNNRGFEAQNNMRVTIADSTAQQNAAAGFIADGTVSTEMNIMRSESAHNNVGIQSGNGGTNRVRVATSFIFNNSTGFSAVGGGLIDSGQDNVLIGNPTPGAPTGTFGKS